MHNNPVQLTGPATSFSHCCWMCYGRTLKGQQTTHWVSMQQSNSATGAHVCDAVVIGIGIDVWNLTLLTEHIDKQSTCIRSDQWRRI